jgi:hypothetical protein
MANLAEGSGRFHSIFPGEYKLTVLPRGYSKIYEVEMVGPHQGFDVRLFHRVERDRASRAKFVGMPQFDLHPDTHGPYLDAAFEKAHGASYRQFLSLLHKLIDGAHPAKGAFPTLFIDRQEALRVLRPSGLSKRSLSIMLDGFTVDPEKMTVEIRRLWNPKQENRALWRGFFLFPHTSGAHLMFSREMARENYIQLVNRVCYRRLPKEWVTPETSTALGNLSAAAGQWFEEVVRKNLNEVNISGGQFRRKIGRGSLEVQIPDEVGEIDFLGYDPRNRYLVLVEAKMSFTGVEARFWRDDLDEFIYRKRSYANQFRKKIAWVQRERLRIQKALGYSDIAAIAPAMLTLYPCIAREFISDFPCVSITEFLLDFKQPSPWPYPQILPTD